MQELKVETVAADSKAEITINGVEATNGSATLAAENLNAVNVHIVSRDGEHMTDYLVKLNYTELVDGITAYSPSVYGNQAAKAAQQTVNGSGWHNDTGDFREAWHDNNGSANTMWQSMGYSETQTEGYKEAYIQYDLGQQIPLGELWIWNFNQYNANG